MEVEMVDDNVKDKTKETIKIIDRGFIQRVFYN